MPIGNHAQRFTRLPFVEQDIHRIFGNFNLGNIVNLTPHRIRAVKDKHRVGLGRGAENECANEGGEALQAKMFPCLQRPNY